VRGHVWFTVGAFERMPMNMYTCICNVHGSMHLLTLCHSLGAPTQVDVTKMQEAMPKIDATMLQDAIPKVEILCVLSSTR
jgi:hypothetical protein